MTFTFGRDGKPLYLAGPLDAPAVVERRLAQLTERLGPDGFEFVDDEELVAIRSSEAFQRLKHHGISERLALMWRKQGKTTWKGRVYSNLPSDPEKP